MALFEIKDIDREVYETELRDFLPEKIFDIHTHIWLDSLVDAEGRKGSGLTVSWTRRVALDNSIEDLQESYRLMFPDKQCEALIFANKIRKSNVDVLNQYVKESSIKSGFPALYFSHPEQSAEKIEQEMQEPEFYGLKSYLDLSPAYLPGDEIRCLDFFPPHQLEVLDRYGYIMMLHIPRSGRLRDKVNVAQILEIKEKYPNIKLIIAHVGRAYCKCDLGTADFDALKELQKAPDLLFDITANCNDYVFAKLLEHTSPEHVLFGSDLPILRMRMRRIEQDGHYVNIVPPGLYGDVSGDKNMAEAESVAEGEKLTFFMYEECRAMKRAAEAVGLSRSDVEKIFYSNARKLIDDIKASKMEAAK